MDNPTRLLLEKTVFELECSGLSHAGAGAGADVTIPTSMAFSSGMQAVTSILLAHSTSGQEGTTVLIPTDVYHGVRSLLSDVFVRHGVKVRELNMVDTPNNNNSDNTNEAKGARAIVDTILEIASASAAFEGGDRPCNESIQNSEHAKDRGSVIVWMETPSNPKCEVVDIEAICEAVRSEESRWKDILEVTTVVDGTMASPLLTRPLEVRRNQHFG